MKMKTLVALKKAVTSRENDLSQIVVSFPRVCPVFDHEFRHNIVKVAVDPRGDSRVKTDINLFFNDNKLSNCPLSQIHVSVRIWTIKINHERARISAVIVKYMLESLPADR